MGDGCPVQSFCHSVIQPQRCPWPNKISLSRYRPRYELRNAGHAKEESMNKVVAAVVALGLAVAFAAPAFAADVTTAKTHAECTKAGGVWDAKAKTCKPKM